MGYTHWQLGLLNYYMSHTQCKSLSAPLQGIFFLVQADHFNLHLWKPRQHLNYCSGCKSCHIRHIVLLDIIITKSVHHRQWTAVCRYPWESRYHQTLGTETDERCSTINSVLCDLCTFAEVPQNCHSLLHCLPSSEKEYKSPWKSSLLNVVRIVIVFSTLFSSTVSSFCLSVNM